MNLIIYTNSHYEEEKALYDLHSKKLIIKGDYYHDKINYVIKGYLLALNIDDKDVAKEYMDCSHESYKEFDFYNEDEPLEFEE